jgi:hypothetical protein
MFTFTSTVTFRFSLNVHFLESFPRSDIPRDREEDFRSFAVEKG